MPYLRLGFEPAFLYRQTDQTGGVVDLEFAHQIFAMRIDGLYAEVEFVRNIHIAESERYQLEHFAFSARELARTPGFGLVEQTREQFGGEMPFPRGDHANGVEDFLSPRVFEQIARHSEVVHFFNVAPFVVHAQNEDVHRRKLAHDFASCLESIELGHADVEQDDIDEIRSQLEQGLLPVRSLGHDFEFVVSVQQSAQTIEQNAVVVDQQDLNGFQYNGIWAITVVP